MSEHFSTTTPLAQAIANELGRGGLFSLSEQEMVRAALHESYTPKTVSKRMIQLKEELSAFGIWVEYPPPEGRTTCGY